MAARAEVACGGGSVPPAIYFYDVPPCAREEAHALLANGGPESRLSAADRLHLEGLMRQVTAVESHLQSRHRVRSPEAASLFFIPAYFPLLFWLDQDTENSSEARHLACVNETLKGVGRLPHLSRRAGYDHLLLYGYEYPHWRRSVPRLLLDSYWPFLRNALLLTVSLWSQGRRAALLDAGLYALQRVVVIPYFSVWDCTLAPELRGADREVVVAFVGSAKDRPQYRFRERLHLALAAQRAAFATDPRLVIQVFHGDADSRHAFARDFQTHRWNLYRSAHFCLIMPGDGNTAGRLFDVMMAGCLPVFLYHPDSYPVLPFHKRIPWSKLALAFPVAGEEDAAVALSSLLAIPEGQRESLRKELLANAPRVALELRGCPSGLSSGLDLISEELQERAGLLEGLLPAVSGALAPPPADEEHWLSWGPAR